VTHETSPEASSSNQPARTHSSIRHANAPIAEVTGIRGGTSRFVPGIANICTMPRCLAQPRSPRLKTGDTLISVNHCTASVETASAQMGWSGCVSDELYDSSCSIDRPSTDPHPRRPVRVDLGSLEGRRWCCLGGPGNAASPQIAGAGKRDHEVTVRNGAKRTCVLERQVLSSANRSQTQTASRC
jgi:hypothetical protein